MRASLAAHGGRLPLDTLASEIGWGGPHRQRHGPLRRFVKLRPELYLLDGLVGEVNAPDWASKSSFRSGAGRLPDLRVLEFFSGIGGLRAAFERACGLAGAAPQLPREWVPIESSHLANGIYSRNFALPHSPLLPRDVRFLKPESIDGADLWLLSPPCQPFTRVGRRLDTADRRAAPLQSLTGLLPQLRRPPEALLLENVVGFEASESWHQTAEVLESSGYEVRLFGLSPLQLGIPNRRPRVYVLARRARGGGPSELRGLEDRFPGAAAAASASLASASPRTLADYIDPSLRDLDAALIPEEFRVPEAMLERLLQLGRRWEVVGPESTSSSTFTSGYSAACNDVHRFGPLLHLGARAGVQRAPGDKLLPGGRELRLVFPGEAVRFFTPGELLRIAGFPESFDFPAGLTTRARYKLVGDSINVDVVAHLIHFLLFEWTSLGGAC